MTRPGAAATDSPASGHGLPNHAQRSVPARIAEHAPPALGQFDVVASLVALTGPFLPGDRFGLSGFYRVLNPLRWDAGLCASCGYPAVFGRGLRVEFVAPTGALWATGVCEVAACRSELDAFAAAWTLVDPCRLVCFGAVR